MSVPSSSLSIYQTGGSLPIKAPTYVKRQADEDLYGWLKQGEFCYVLNSRQMGKSSLRVQIMARLQKEGVACAALDLTEIGSSDITRDEWYAGVIDSLVGSFQLEENFDLEVWWTSLGLLSPSKKLSKFFSEILLNRIVSPIVIFIDEIDSTLKLKFKDDFFALLRACYNQRVDNQEYKRLTFCLLGVASPTDLIADEQSTPFNIGQGVDLKGFQYGKEIEPLTRYLQKIVDNPSEIMRDILEWTGGQPFLTQRLCNLVVKANNPNPDVSQIVQQMIIDNWEAQDEQEHLKTIRKRILSNEDRAGYLLELYRKILKDEQVTINNSSEERELQLSGLVVKKGNILQVYNPVYAKVFNEYWIDTELNKLRPYSESFRTWLLSGKTDDSRLLQGQALLDAEKWASGKQNLGGEDRDFLGASRAKERAIEIEKKDKEAAQERNLLLEEANKNMQEANKKAQKRIRLGSIVLIISLLGAVICGVLAFREGVKATLAKNEAEEAQNELVSTQEQSKQIQEIFIREQENFQILNTQIKSIGQQKENAEKQLKTANKKLMEAQNQFRISEEKQKKAVQAQEIAELATHQANDKTKEAEKKLVEANQRLKQAQKAKNNAQLEFKKIEQELIETDRKYGNINIEIKTVTELVKLAGYLQDKGLSSESNEALRQAGLSFKVQNHNIKQALLLVSHAAANNALNETEKAEKNIKSSHKYLDQVSSSDQVIKQIKVLLYITEASLKNSTELYQQSFNILSQSGYDPYQSSSKIISEYMVEYIHRELLTILKANPEIKTNVETSLKAHYRKRTDNYIKQLETFLKEKQWQKASEITWSAIFYSAQVKNISKNWNWKDTSCQDFRQIENLWYDYSGGRFGFKKQWQIYAQLNDNSAQFNNSTFLAFAQAVGWYNPETGWTNYNELNWSEDSHEESPNGHLPPGVGGRGEGKEGFVFLQKCL